MPIAAPSTTMMAAPPQICDGPRAIKGVVASVGGLEDQSRRDSKRGKRNEGGRDDNGSSDGRSIRVGSRGRNLVDRRKCILFSHSETLFSFLVADVRKADISPIGPFLVSRVQFELATEELPVDLFGRLDPDSVHIAKTASRSILGSMNDLALHWEHAVEVSRGLEWTDVAGTNRRLRRMPMGALRYANPIELVRERADR